MRILFIPYGTSRAPATRYRVMQYLPHLKNRGIEYSVFSAISEFSTFLMVRSPDFGVLLKFLYYLYIFVERLARSFFIIVIAKKYDVIFLQRTTFPLNIETLLKFINRNIIFDIDDAVYLPDKMGKDPVTRIKKYIKESEVVNILRLSKAVVVENEYIKDFVSQYCNDILKIPGPIDIDRFFVRHKNETKDIVIGWIGSPATTSYLHHLDNILKIIERKYKFVRFKFVGLGRYENSDIEFEKTEWDYNTEVKDLQSFDIGIMPMPDNEWTRGKLGCKMLQYMAVGVPAVVSYTPTNAEIIEDGRNGFFATTEEEWIKILSALIEKKELRTNIGKEGRNTVLKKCSLTGNIDKLIDIFNRLCLAK